MRPWPLAPGSLSGPGPQLAERINVGVALRVRGTFVGDTSLPHLQGLTSLCEIAPEPTGHGLPLGKCEAYNRVYDQSVSGVVRPQFCLLPSRRRMALTRRSAPWDDARRSWRARRAGKIADRPRSSCRFR